MKREVLRATFHVGVDELGSTISYRKRKDIQAFATDIGLELTNKTGETVLVPYSNVRSVKCASEKAD